MSGLLKKWPARSMEFRLRVGALFRKKALIYFSYWFSAPNTAAHLPLTEVYLPAGHSVSKRALPRIQKPARLLWETQLPD
jgi:hypothetical protein